MKSPDAIPRRTRLRGSGTPLRGMANANEGSKVTVGARGGGKSFAGGILSGILEGIETLRVRVVQGGESGVSRGSGPGRVFQHDDFRRVGPCERLGCGRGPR